MNASPVNAAPSTHDPFLMFGRWQEDARRDGKSAIPEAACLSTIDPEGWPEGRMVLVKMHGPEGFVFFTNRESNKAKSLACVPRASLTFYWDSSGRQIRIQGTVQPISEEESDAYFLSRPRLSQLGAWASEQSRPLENRMLLLRRLTATTLKFMGRPVPRPPHWGGYRLIPRSIEFWQNRAHRLHDRLVYQRRVDGGWDIRRLYP